MRQFNVWFMDESGRLTGFVSKRTEVEAREIADKTDLGRACVPGWMSGPWPCGYGIITTNGWAVDGSGWREVLTEDDDGNTIVTLVR